PGLIKSARVCGSPWTVAHLSGHHYLCTRTAPAVPSKYHQTRDHQSVLLGTWRHEIFAPRIRNDICRHGPALIGSVLMGYLCGISIAGLVVLRASPVDRPATLCVRRSVVKSVQPSLIAGKSPWQP